MSKVVEITSRSRHLSGTALCTGCGHEWAAACHPGSQTLECPSCRRYHGVMKGPVIPPESFQCECGNRLFYITREGFVCRLCGVEAASEE